jgi:F0F1-type ATP synthase delta subunit
MENTYAEALWEMTKKGIDAKKAVAALRELLERYGRAALLPRIGRAFMRIAAREERKSMVLLSVAREKDARKAEHAAAEALRDAGATAKDVAVHVDDSLIGGWRLEGRERLLDASYKKYLLDVYNRATN